MSRKPVHLAVYDTYADWETGHATAYLARAGYEIRTAGPSREPVTSLGGLRVQPACALDDVRPSESSLLILPGADLWDAGDDLAPFARKAREFLDAGVPVAAICGATGGSRARGCWTTGSTPAPCPSTWRPRGTAAASGTSTRTP